MRHITKTMLYAAEDAAWPMTEWELHELLEIYDHFGDWELGQFRDRLYAAVRATPKGDHRTKLHLQLREVDAVIAVREVLQGKSKQAWSTRPRHRRDEENWK